MEADGTTMSGGGGGAHMEAAEEAAVKCECCSLVEECTEEYIAKVKERYMGRWVCGLCAVAVDEEMSRSGRRITVEEALDRHVAFASALPPPPAKAAEHLVAAVSRLLRRCLDSPPRRHRLTPEL